MKIPREQAEKMYDYIILGKDGKIITLRCWQEHDWIEKTALEEFEEKYAQIYKTREYAERVIKDVTELHNLGIKAIEEEKAKK